MMYLQHLSSIYSPELQHLDNEESDSGIDSDDEDDVVTSDILILGAGMAGISAAKRLTERGLENFVIVEGADRIGGRVREVNFGGVNVEVGANWVHFSNMKKSEINPIELMIKEAHLNFVSDDYSDVIFRYKGGVEVKE